MKEIRKEEKVSKIVYEAIDGEVFESKECCLDYEQTAKCVINSRFKDLIVSKNNAWDLMGGMEDNDIIVVQVLSENDIDTILQRYYIDNTYWMNEANSERRDNFYKIVKEAFENKDFIMFGINCDGYLYFLNTVSYYINNLKKATEKQQ